MPLKLTQPNDKTVVGVPSIFLEQFLPKAPPAFSVCYLFAYSCCFLGKKDMTNKDMAEALDMIESDLVWAWKYWSKQNIISYDDTTQTIEFLDLTAKPSSQPVQKPFLLNAHPNYTPEELSVYAKKSNETKALFASAQSHLGGFLSYRDMNALFGLYDWLGLPMDVIEILLAYCTQNNHRSMSYIEKVGIDWAQSGVTTIEKAMERIHLYNNKYRSVMKALGLGGRDITEADEKYLKKWFEEYAMPENLILYACEKTIINIGKGSFPYADRIVTAWVKEKIKTLDQAKQADIAFTASKKNKAVSTASKKDSSQTPKKNRFVNYEQREWDFDALEKMEKAHLKKKLEE